MQQFVQMELEWLEELLLPIFMGKVSLMWVLHLVFRLNSLQMVVWQDKSGFQLQAMETVRRCLKWLCNICWASCSSFTQGLLHSCYVCFRSLLCIQHMNAFANLLSCSLVSSYWLLTFYRFGILHSRSCWGVYTCSTDNASSKTQ